jgi:hypothetical protein
LFTKAEVQFLTGETRDAQGRESLCKKAGLSLCTLLRHMTEGLKLGT